MKIRRYMGSNTQEAILKVKMDLGNDAVILNTRKVRQKGLFKMFSKPMVEVLAALDEDSNKKERVPAEQKNPVPAREPQPKLKNTELKEQKITELESKVSSMESLLHRIYNQIQDIGGRNESDCDEVKQETSSKVLQLFHNNLIKNEVDTELTKMIIDSTRQKIGKDADANETTMAIYSVVANTLGTPDSIKLREDGKPTVVVFLGPTGVGKTTTLAKLAANYSLNYKKTVGLITADTYRIAAVEQLKTYGEILGMSVSVIYSASEIRDTINQNYDKDIILVDTAGRTFKNKGQFEELKQLVEELQADEIFLVLSATTSIRNCREIVSHYSFLEDYKLIFTKIDETPSAGVILNIKHMTGKKLSYITTGQSVPDDIEMANIEKIVKNLLGSTK